MDLSTLVGLLNLTVMLAVPSKCVIDILTLSQETVDWYVYLLKARIRIADIVLY
jgi:hypothetical protein